MSVLFICASNINRSQMAEAFLHFYIPYLETRSAGVNPPQKALGAKVGRITGDGLEVMRMVGVDMSAAIVKAITPEMMQGVEHVISMVPRKELPTYIADTPNLTIWDVPDPGGKPREVLLKTRDHIRTLVRTFAEELAATRAVAAFCILSTPSREVLLQHRTSDAPTNPGRWQLFGGAREDKETPRQTLTRELHEELGMVIEPHLFEYFLSVAIDPTHSVEIYTATIPDGARLTLGEGAGYRYVEQHDVSSLDLEPNTRTALEKFYIP